MRDLRCVFIIYIVEDFLEKGKDESVEWGCRVRKTNISVEIYVAALGEIGIPEATAAGIFVRSAAVLKTLGIPSAALNICIFFCIKLSSHGTFFAKMKHFPAFCFIVG